MGVVGALILPEEVVQVVDVGVRITVCNNNQRGEDDGVGANQGGRSLARARGPPPKSLDSDENSKPKHTLFCRELRFVAIYALFFGDLWAKKVPFWVKTVLLGQEVHYYMVYIAYFTELNSKI